jgi:hypothetical protein
LLRALPRKSGFRRFLPVAISAGLGTLPGSAREPNVTFEIPPVKTRVDIQNQPIAITAWGKIIWTRKEKSENLLRLSLTADLSDLQQNISAVLRAVLRFSLDRSERCGERVAVEHGPEIRDAATLRLEPEIAASRLRARSASFCGQDAWVRPCVERSPALCFLPGRRAPISRLLVRLRCRTIRRSTIQATEFQDAGSGRLEMVLGGEIRVSDEQIRQLAEPVKQQVSSR